MEGTWRELTAMLQAEIEFVPTADYMLTVQGGRVQPWMRRDLVDWLQEVRLIGACVFCGIDPRSLFLPCRSSTFTSTTARCVLSLSLFVAANTQAFNVFFFFFFFLHD